MSKNGMNTAVLLGAAVFLLFSCSSGSKKENAMDGQYSLVSDPLTGTDQLTMDLKIPAGDGGQDVPQNFDLNRKLGAGAGAAGGAPEVSGVWVGIITSNDNVQDILVWLKEDGGFVAADVKKYSWQIIGGNLSIAYPDNPTSADIPLIPATEAQLESGSFTFTENQQTMSMERIIAGTSWRGLWGATVSNVPAALLPPSGYTHIALFEDDGTVWVGEVTGEGTYSTSGSSMSIEITWPEEGKELADKTIKAVIPAGNYDWHAFAVGPGESNGLATVTISSGAVLWGHTEYEYGGSIHIRDGGTLVVDGVTFKDAQYFYLEDGAAMIIENSTIEFTRWSGCRAWGDGASNYNYGFNVGTRTKLVIRNSTINAKGEIPCLIAAYGNPDWFGHANQVDITIEGNTITTDGAGGIALAAGVIRGNTFNFTQANNPYGIMAAKIENPLPGKEALEIENNTFISPNSGRAIVFTSFFPPRPPEFISSPTNVVGNQFTGFTKVFSSEPDGGGLLYLYQQDLNISGNTYTDCGQIYSPENEFFTASFSSGLQATAVYSSQINLVWVDSFDNEDGFKIERKTGSGGTYSEIDTVGFGETVYHDTGLLPGTIYYYRVNAYNFTGSLGSSNEAWAETPNI
jgi:hypothetical protein